MGYASQLRAALGSSPGAIQEIADTTEGLYLLPDGTIGGTGLPWVVPQGSAARWSVYAVLISGDEPEGTGLGGPFALTDPRSWYFSGPGSCILELQFLDVITGIGHSFSPQVEVSGIAP